MAREPTRPDVTVPSAVTAVTAVDVDGSIPWSPVDGGPGRVELTHVTKRFGDVTAVRDLTLTVEDRELMVLLGPSGCGKSTVLRLIAGLEDPAGGSVTIGGRDVTGVDPRRRDVAMVFQSYALYPHMTVRRNMEFPLRLRDVGKAERRRLVEDAAALLGLSELLDRRPAQLSGGQRQRVALARATVRRPKVFLMDEPLSNLDARLRVQMRIDLVELERRLAVTTIYVTHDQVEAMTMGDRVAVMRDGRLEQVGTPQEVYDRPATLFVASFIGSPPMNLLAARHFGLHLDGRQLLVGVRPEHVRLGADGPLVGRVVRVESLGHEYLVSCRLEDDEIVVARWSTLERAPDEGALVRITAHPSHLHLFDEATGARADD